MSKKAVKGKVFVGLSGGVDSSVSAALLKEQGFDVSGVFIKVWQPEASLTGGCTWREDRLDAMRVCAKLDIPFYTLDLEKEYKKEVIDYMLAEYQMGRTPNPDVMCNKYVKFGGFFDWAMNHGADYVATGHYAKIERKGSSNTPVKLLAGDDKNKDQSYFLWTLTQKQLSKTLFPVGDIEKPQVRKLAEKFGLPTALKKDSQGLCFIGKVDMMDFLKHFLKAKPGSVLNKKGEIIGEHEGAELYTIGQRHGFTLTKGSPNSKRSFIIEKNIKNNTITVANDFSEEVEEIKREFLLKNVNWISGFAPDESKIYQARIRYRGILDECQIKILEDKKSKISFKNDQKAPAKGQSIVIYDGEVCLGGGIIE